jgi:hypothetical protein
MAGNGSPRRNPRAVMEAKIQELLSIKTQQGLNVSAYLRAIGLRSERAYPDDKQASKAMRERFKKAAEFIKTLDQLPIQDQFLRRDTEARDKIIETMELLHPLIKQHEAMDRTMAEKSQQATTGSDRIDRIQKQIIAEGLLAFFQHAYSLLQDICDASEPKIIVPANLRIEQREME